MSGRVTISRKAAEDLLRAIGHDRTTWRKAREELERALAPKPKSSAVKKTERKRREKQAEAHSIYEQVAERAGGFCEGCGAAFSPSDPPEMHHAFGRVRVKQSVRNCLLLHLGCHKRLTDNIPNAAECWMRVAEAFHRLGFTESEREADARIEKHLAKAELRESSR